MQNPAFNEDSLEIESVCSPTTTTSQEPVQMAVEVTAVDYTYDRNYFDLVSMIDDPLMRKVNPPVLQKISIAAPKGKIFGLLGSSGCGKTTLLKCILGRLKPKAGSIHIFGQKPGSRNCPVPGPGVGYMPQELALFPEFTIAETLRYFGQLYRMASEEIKFQTNHIVEFLHLPGNERIIKQLSGGQQRRVSLACALIHNPPLMILDEPTVGVDPMLRAAIWNHLESLCRTNGLSVIITTHYIEEARAAETIGLMRNGQLLVQTNPETLLKEHNLPRLEDVFLKLCILQDSQATERPEEENQNQAKDNENCDSTEQIELPQIERTQEENKAETSDTNNNNQTTLIQAQAEQPTILYERPAFFDPYRFNALFTKNIIRLKRNLVITLFYLLIPALQFGLFILCSGKTPSNLSVAIVNDESPPEMTAQFLSLLSPGAIIQRNVSTVEEGESLVREGKAWAVMKFYGNFSQAWDDRRLELASAENDTIEASNIHLYLDMSNQVVGLSVFQNMFLAIQTMVKQFLIKHDYNPNSLATPIEFTEIVYGTMDLSSMTELITPGIIILIAFFSTAAVTGLSLILERKDGLLERSMVAGVKPMECLFSHIFTQTMVMIVQQVVLFAAIFYVFAVPSKGPVGWVFLICFLQGIAGIMYGLLISSIFPDEVTAAIIVMGSLLPTIMISGIFWPVQSISVWLHWISLCLPQTLAMDSIRSILARGWDITHFDVLLGVASTSGWTVVYLLITLFVFSKFI